MSKFEQHLDENGELHRIDGPAIIYPNGGMYWYRHGRYHRRGGPAAVYDGVMLWSVSSRRLRAADQLPERAHPIMELFL